jgi:hypothetical protein
MNKRHLFGYSVVGALLTGLGAVGHAIPSLTGAGKGGDPWVRIVLTVLTPGISAVVGIIIPQVRERIGEWVTGALNQSVCKIYLFGHRGTGKTTLIQNVLSSAEQPPALKPTEYYDCFSNTVSLDTRGKRRVKIEMADYKGEKPSTIVIDLPEDFAGPKESRKINAVLFFVDIAPRLTDEITGEPRDDDETLKWLRSDTESKIRQRVEQHREYLSKYTLEIVFSLVYSPRLTSVRLLINKVDLMRRLFAEGYMADAKVGNVEEYMRSLFADIEANLKEACSVNKIDDFSVKLVSAKHDEGTRSMFANLINTCVSRAGRSGL